MVIYLLDIIFLIVNLPTTITKYMLMNNAIVLEKYGLLIKILIHMRHDIPEP